MQRILRRDFVAVWVAVAAIGCSLAVSVLHAEEGKSNKKRHNIVWILVDDLRYDTFGFAGHPIVKTPNIDRLAAEGVQFANAFVVTSICGPSRQSFMTGIYHEKRAERVEFQKQLGDAGYQIFEYGKMRGTGNPKLSVKINGVKKHLAEAMPEAVEGFLGKRDTEKPFCLSLGYACTHFPFTAAKWTADLYKEDAFPVPASRTTEHFSQLSGFLQKSLNATRYKKVFPPANPEAAFQKFVRNYMRCVSTIDRSVGQVIDLLDKLKLRENTIVVFTSDNGFFLGEHGFGGKWLMHEPSIRIPMMVCGPAVPKDLRGKKLSEMVLNVDLKPTLLEAAGLSPKAELDGRSFWPLVCGKKLSDWRTDFLYRFRYRNFIPTCEGVRTKDFKYIAYYDFDDQAYATPIHEELFDLGKDPGEVNNLAKRDEFKATLEKLRERKAELRKKYYPEGRVPESGERR